MTRDEEDLEVEIYGLSQLRSWVAAFGEVIINARTKVSTRRFMGDCKLSNRERLNSNSIKKLTYDCWSSIDDHVFPLHNLKVARINIEKAWEPEIRLWNCFPKAASNRHKEWHFTTNNSGGDISGG